MEIKGKIIAVLEPVSGEGRNGTWKLQEYVLETQEQYPKKVCFGMFGDRIEQFPMKIDDMVVVSCDIESREYNGRWYTSVRAWKIENEANATTTPPPPATAVPSPPPTTFDNAQDEEDDGSGLPF